jgi:hypothetical protein
MAKNWTKGLKIKKGALTRMAKAKHMSLSEFCGQAKNKLSGIARKR